MKRGEGIDRMEPREDNQQKYNVPILEKGFGLLELVADHPQGLTMQEIVNRLELPKTTVFRLLNSLCEMGYLGKNEQTFHYFIARRLLRLGLASLSESNIVEQSLQHMKALRDDIRESIMLGVLMDREVVLLEQLLGSHDFAFMIRPGSKFRMHCSAPGKLFLAMLPDDECDRLLDAIDYTKFNEKTICNKERMLGEIGRIRKNGYAIDAQEELDGVHCVAAPIFNEYGNIAATIWTSGPSGRIPESKFPELGRKLIETTDVISANLGYINKN